MIIKIENFEGPLDLLLQLIENQKLDITQISLLAVTGQYINFLEQLEYKKPEILADFLLIAAKLLYIKSRALLPELNINSIDEDIDLAQQLKMYKKFIDASKIINNLFIANDNAYGRLIIAAKSKIEYQLTNTLTQNRINKIFAKIVKELVVADKLPQKIMKKVISIKEKIKYIKQLILEKESFDFDELSQPMYNKADLIISFLSLLELIKQKDAVAEQTDNFGTILVMRSSYDK